MKTIWKVLIGAAAVAAVTPYQVKKDEETGAVTLKAATWAGTYTKNGEDKNFTIKLLPGIIKDAECESGETCASAEEPAAEDETGDEGGITIEVDIKDDEEAPAEGPKPEEA